MSLGISDSLGSSKLSLKMTGLDEMISVVPYMLILLILKDVLEKKEPNITTGKLYEILGFLGGLNLERIIYWI